MVPGRLRPFDQVEHERPPEPAPMQVVADVDRYLHRPGVGAPRFPGRERRPTDNPPATSATVAEWAGERPWNHASHSPSVSGSTWNVQVDRVT